MENNPEENGAITHYAEGSTYNDYFESFPPGYRFLPTDEELVVHYLINKVLNRPLPINRIRTVNVYHHNPQQLTGMYTLHRDDEKYWYFFTQRTRRYPNGNRPSRVAADGYWKSTGADKVIKSKGQPVGYKRALVFYHGKPGNAVKTNWLMHEYTQYKIHQKSAPSGPSTSRALLMKLDDWVLCKIYKKAEKLKNGPEHEAVPNTDPTPPSDQGHPLPQPNPSADNTGQDWALPSEFDDDSLDALLAIDMSELFSSLDFMAGDFGQSEPGWSINARTNW